MSSKTKVSQSQKSKNVINIKINAEPKKKRRRRTTKPRQVARQQQQPILFPTFQPTPRIIYQQNQQTNADQTAKLQASLNSLNSFLESQNARGLAQVNRFQPPPSLYKRADFIDREKVFVNEQMKQREPLFEANQPLVEPTNEEEGKGPATMPLEDETIVMPPLTEREKLTEDLYDQYLDLRNIAKEYGIILPTKVSKNQFNTNRNIQKTIETLRKAITDYKPPKTV